MARLHAPGSVVARSLELPHPAGQLERAQMRAIGGVYRHHGGVDGQQLQGAFQWAGRYVGEGGGEGRRRGLRQAHGGVCISYARRPLPSVTRSLALRRKSCTEYWMKSASSAL